LTILPSDLCGRYLVAIFLVTVETELVLTPLSISYNLCWRSGGDSVPERGFGTVPPTDPLSLLTKLR